MEEEGQFRIEIPLKSERWEGTKASKSGRPIHGMGGGGGLGRPVLL